ncbi:MAG: cupin domain-containing protein [Kordiimonadaceae bacterium]|jgi:quercetin dioxygenase-like cupin family protein|nr:cupin domain-containing protein [Kordiimonadaceae bacterium]MBT6031033.1 cupin domain-containing protein [Kordiimonadaceae bacterium]
MQLPSVNWNEMKWKKIRDGVYQKAFTGEGATMAMHKLEPQHEPRPHKHHYEQLVYIIAGEVDFHVGDDVHRLTAGGLLVVPPNIMHHAVVIGEEDVLNLDIFTPKRPEFVENQ